MRAAGRRTGWCDTLATDTPRRVASLFERVDPPTSYELAEAFTIALPVHILQPVVQQDVVAHHWLTVSQFAVGIALVRSPRGRS
jgi:hypothetical protein